MRQDYLPTRQNDLRAWLLNFDGLVYSDPARFGLLEAEAQSLHERIANFISALDLSLAEETRNKGSIAFKEIQKATMLELLRPVAMRIRDDMGVAPEDKVLIGLRLPDAPSPVPAPATVPVLAINGPEPLVHAVRFHDVNTPETAAKPDGAEGLQLFCATVAPGAAEPAGPEAARFIGLVTSQRYSLSYPSSDAGKTAWYWARWYNRKGQPGPWSAPVSRTVAA